MPRKTFVNGDVLTASDLNDFLMNQSVMTFASAAARTTALPAPIEGMVTYLADNNLLQVFTGASFVNVDVNAIPKSTVTTEGDLIVGTGSATVARLAKGTAGQVLTAGASTLSFETPTAPVPISTVTTAGDLIVGTGSSAVTRLGKGTDGQVLGVVDGDLEYVSITADSMTLLSTTTLSGISTTISSIPADYKDLKIVIRNFGGSANARPQIRLNEDTGSNYHTYFGGVPVSATTFFRISDADFVATSGNVFPLQIEITDYASGSAAKMIKSYFSSSESSSSNDKREFFFAGGQYTNASAINSITIFGDDGTTTYSGTVLIYGVN